MQKYLLFQKLMTKNHFCWNFQINLKFIQREPFSKMQYVKENGTTINIALWEICLKTDLLPWSLLFFIFQPIKAVLMELWHVPHPTAVSPPTSAVMVWFTAWISTLMSPAARVLHFTSDFLCDMNYELRLKMIKY